MEQTIKQAKLSKSLISAHMKGYAAEQPGLKPVMAFYRDIFGVQKKHSSLLPLYLPHISQDEILRRLDAGMPLLQGDALPELDVLRRIVVDIAAVIERKSPVPPEGLDDFLKRFGTDDTMAQQLISAYIERRDEDLAAAVERTGLEPDVAIMLLHMSLAPFFWRKAAGIRAKVSLDQVISGDCPVCGARPVMGFLRTEDGLRVLECSLCGTRWGTPRMTCPFCRTQNPEQLRYHFAEGDEARRLYVCDACKGYIKITNLATTGELVIPLEDLATAQLDAVAEEKGCERKTASVFG
jgi:FdhE protein